MVLRLVETDGLILGYVDYSMNQEHNMNLLLVVMISVKVSRIQQLPTASRLFPTVSLVKGAVSL